MSSTTAMLEDTDIRDRVTSKKYYDIAAGAELKGDRMRAIEAYEAAYAADPDSADVCFRLAYNLDLVGEEDEALHLYEECARQQPAPLHALINLAIMYEDRGNYAAAERCLRQVLATDPNHNRSRLYIKDVMASKAMVIDDDLDQDYDSQSGMLDQPVTDFDLSVRTRNALRKMNIRTLSDLVGTTEAELRNFKNFGESSIDEIKAMLSQRGLRLGQISDDQQNAAKKAVYEQLRQTTGANEEMLNLSVNDLNLSVRARKALALLNVHSMGDLCMRTEAELMGVKNFGMTSLLEIKAKLGERGLGLRKLEE